MNATKATTSVYVAPLVLPLGFETDDGFVGLSEALPHDAPDGFHYVRNNMTNTTGLVQITRMRWAREKITLASGIEIIHTLMENGAQTAIVLGRESGEMSEPEWQEYCELVRASK